MTKDDIEAAYQRLLEEINSAPTYGAARPLIEDLSRFHVHEMGCPCGITSRPLRERVHNV